MTNKKLSRKKSKLNFLLTNTLIKHFSMKKFLLNMLLLAALTVPWATHAQNVSEYSLTVDTTTYTSIATTGTALTFSSTDDGYATCTVPFAFPFGETTLPAGFSIAASANGFLYLGSTTASGTTANATGTFNVINAILAQDAHIGRYPTSGASYKLVVDDNGDSSFVIEYRALGTYSTPYGTYTYQVILHPSGNINIMFDTVAMGAPTHTLRCFLRNGANNDNLFLSTSWTNPVFATTLAAMPSSGLPTHGMRYTFTRPVVTCPKPAALTYSGITPTDATVSWIEMGTASSWSLEYADSAFTPGTGHGTVVPATDTFVSLSGLAANTIYHVYVHAICDGGDTSRNRYGTFRTKCSPTNTLPYAENFDSWGTYTASAYPICWEKGGTYAASTSYPYCQSSGFSGNCLFMSVPANQSLAAIVQPFASTISITTLQAGFKAKSTVVGQPLYVGVMSDPSNLSTLVYVDTLRLGTNWTDYEVAFNRYADTGRYIAFVGGNTTTAAGFYLDELTINTRPTCLAPRDLTISNPTSNTLTLSWHERGDATAWDIVYDTVPITNFAAATNLVAATANPTTITNLDPTTHYYFYVRANCGNGDTSHWSLVADGNTGFGCGDSLSYGIAVTGNLATTTTYTPAYSGWGSSYTQTIYTAAELNDMGIYRGYLHSIAVDWTNTNTSAPKNIAIYLGTTTQTGFATTTSWVSTNSLQQVYSDSNNVHTIGWNIYQLDSNFYWDGTSNLVFAFLSNHNGSSTTTNTAGSYASQYTSEYRTIYKYADNTIMVPATITAAAASSRTYYRTDIRIEACVDIPTCPKPRDVVASNIDSTSATLSWMEVGSASSWNIVLSTTPLTDPQTAANPLAASTNPFAITGLTPNTVYYVYIQADCSSETSRWTSACMFRTQCGATVLPLVENFDTYGASARPSCWHAIVPSGTLQTSTGYAASGNYSMYSYTSQGSYNVLISPELNEDIHTLMVNFKVSGDGDLAPEYPSTVVVGVMNNYNSIATFYPIDTVAPTVAEQFAEFDVSFAGYPADSLNGRYIAFKFAPIGNLAESCWTYLDDVTISLIPVCNRPNSLTVIGVDTSSVTLSWSDSTGSAWQVVYGPRGCNPDSMLLIPSNVISNIANDSITINNLTFGTSYDFYVRTECATDYSTWRGDASATVGNQYIMATTGIDTITGCGFVIYDNGDSNGNYASSCNSTLVIDPGVGNLATIRGRMATESG